MLASASRDEGVLIWMMAVVVDDFAKKRGEKLLGRNVIQTADGSIRVDQDEWVAKMEPITMDPDIKG